MKLFRLVVLHQQADIAIKDFGQYGGGYTLKIKVCIDSNQGVPSSVWKHNTLIKLQHRRKLIKLLGPDFTSTLEV